MRFSGKKQQGFTLVEIIVGIVIMAIAIVYLSSVLFPQARNSVSPVMQVKAAELAQTLMNEMLAKSYDENSDHDGSRWRCDETIVGITISSCTTTIGPDSGETNRLLYDDVDDFDTDGAYLPAVSLEDSSGQSIGENYPNFAVRIDVSHDASGFNGSSGEGVAKRVDIYVQLPASQGNEIVFTAYRGNY